jgi:hypothetical protein
MRIPMFIHLSALRPLPWLIALLGAAGLHAGPAVQAWSRRYGGQPSIDATAAAVAVDLAGNAYVTGSVVATNGLSHYATIAYSSGGTPLWTNSYSRPGSGSDDRPIALALDASSGNLYVTGDSHETSHDEVTTIAYSGGGAPLWTNRYVDQFARLWAAGVAVNGTGTVYVAASAGGMMSVSVVVIAYSDRGTPLWTNRDGGVLSYGPVALGAIAAGGDGGVYITGWFEGPTYSAEYATVAYSSWGLALWTNRYNCSPTGLSYPNAMAVAGTGNVYVTGQSDGTGTGNDYAAVAYSSSGIPLWTNRYNGPGDGEDFGLAVAVDALGNVYVTGGSDGVTGIWERATIAYSSTGTALWTNRYAGPGNLGSQGSQLAVDSRGDVIVGGWSATTTGGYDYTTIAYSPSGTPLWTNFYNGPANADDGPMGLAAGPDGAVYVTGTSEGVHGGTTNSDFATIKYVPSPDILFAGTKRLPDATCRLTLNAPTNVAYRLDASADLKSWLPLTNFPPLPATSLQYTDTLAPGFPTRFYRTVWSP